MKESVYKSYDELPLFLNAETVARALGVSPSSGYELMRVAYSSYAPAAPLRARPAQRENAPFQTEPAALGFRLG